MRLPRASGILLHPTSLPGQFGIGDLGPPAHEFVALLAATGQRWWQMLPVGPTGFGNSPYQSHSSYAGNPLLVSPERIVGMGLLTKRELSSYPELPRERVDFDSVFVAKNNLFRRAFQGFDPSDKAFRIFDVRAQAWLEDYALYMALKEAHGGRAWNDWEPDIAARKPAAMAEWAGRLAETIRYHKFVQFLFDHQWNELREHCFRHDVRLIGDLPIFVSQDSADVWARPELFQLDEHGRPKVVAGVPPDFFSETGQLWGNPLYDWQRHADEGFAWWISRVKATTDRVDLVRLDHFRGFEAYWEVPGDAHTAAAGRWVKGPGAAFLNALKTGLGGLPLIAEDLGCITPEVEALREEFELPGMRVLQFAFGDDPNADIYLPYRHVPHCVVYPGTHDNDTTVGWFTATDVETTQSHEAIEMERAFVRRFLNCRDDQTIHWDMIRLAFSSVADTTIIPLQDILGLGGEARMNVPGTAEGNWTWRYLDGDLNPSVVDPLSDFTALFARWTGDVPERWRTPRRKPAPVVSVVER
jgi:4-alpha-glucanotransferase